MKRFALCIILASTALSVPVRAATPTSATAPADARAIAAIRARPACLSCHEDHREGDVLGALGYGLGRLTIPSQSASPSCQPDRVTSS